jgi:hypothetical protein
VVGEETRRAAGEAEGSTPRGCTSPAEGGTPAIEAVGAAGAAARWAASSAV